MDTFDWYKALKKPDWRPTVYLKPHLGTHLHLSTSTISYLGTICDHATMNDYDNKQIKNTT